VPPGPINLGQSSRPTSFPAPISFGELSLERTGREGSSKFRGRWVKICGASKDDLDIILQHFSRYGEIEQIVTSKGHFSNSCIFLKFTVGHLAILISLFAAL